MLDWHGGKTLRWVVLSGLTVHFALAAQGGTFALPVNQTNGWQFLKYRKILPNTFRCTPTGLVIGITNSAAPAVFPLTNELRVVELQVSGRISGSLKIPPRHQGEKGFDDYALRVGLVESGTRTLSWWEKRTAADWLKKLFALAPPDKGIGKVHFFNVGTDASQIGHGREYSNGVPMQQTAVTVPDDTGHFTFTKRFARPLNVIAVWISCDGDDTHSRFAVTIERAELATVKD